MATDRSRKHLGAGTSTLARLASITLAGSKKADDEIEDEDPLDGDDEDDEDDETKPKKSKKKSKAEDGGDETDENDKAARAARRTGPTLAQQVVAAGQKRRAETAPPKPTGLALQVINAGRRARGEPEL